MIARTPARRNSSRMWTEWLTPDGEGDGLAALAEPVPVRDDVADELGRVHALGKLRSRRSRRPGSDAGQVRFAGA